MALTRTRSILTKDPDLPRTWNQVDEETDVLRREVYIDIDTYRELGEPEVITLTIEPGDKLNEEN